jgi:hypothetical protein
VPGDPRAAFLTVATYPDAGGAVAVRALAGPKIELPGGAVAATRPERRTSVYLAFPASELEVEVYDPSPERARALVVAGRIRPLR